MCLVKKTENFIAQEGSNSSSLVFLTIKLPTVFLVKIILLLYMAPHLGCFSYHACMIFSVECSVYLDALLKIACGILLVDGVLNQSLVI